MILQDYKQCVSDISERQLAELKTIINNYHDIIILGNGGSNAISSHIAEDYTKTLGKRALSFSDSARMSCYANDYGWERAYSMFIKHFAIDTTLVILISSSGNSDNILQAAEYCVVHSIPFITLSGFLVSNKLNNCYGSKSLINFHINSNDYGIVECIHELILHSVL
jgi:D-sedoheptulose 7-phosphate isomerase